MKPYYKYLIILSILLLLSPTGIILPAILKSSCAWGEWSREEFLQLLGYIPSGIANLSGIWHPILPDYNFRTSNGSNIIQDSIAYVFSGVLGSGICFLLTMVLFRSGDSGEN